MIQALQEENHKLKQEQSKYLYYGRHMDAQLADRDEKIELLQHQLQAAQKRLELYEPGWIPPKGRKRKLVR